MGSPAFVDLAEHELANGAGKLTVARCLRAFGIRRYIKPKAVIPAGDPGRIFGASAQEGGFLPQAEASLQAVFTSQEKGRTLALLCKVRR
jgi:hypothetical protein